MVRRAYYNRTGMPTELASRMEQLRQIIPHLEQLASEAQGRLAGSERWVLLKSVRPATGGHLTKEELRAFTHVFGDRTLTDPSDPTSDIWDVTPRKDLPDDYVTTVTENAAEAELHTDSS